MSNKGDESVSAVTGVSGGETFLSADRWGMDAPGSDRIEEMTPEEYAEWEVGYRAWLEYQERLDAEALNLMEGA